MDAVRLLRSTEASALAMSTLSFNRLIALIFLVVVFHMVVVVFSTYRSKNTIL